MGGIFVSYRRGLGASEAAGRLHDRLATRYGADNVFMDVDRVRPGMDFGEAIGRAIEESTVVLAVIDPHWAVDPDGRDRIAEAGDYVRLEVGTALQRGVTVIPVLVLGAEMPTVDALPPDLRPLTSRQAAVISHERFSTDIIPLETELNELLGERRNGSSVQRLRMPPLTPLRLAIVGGAVVAVLAVVLVIAATRDSGQVSLLRWDRVDDETVVLQIENRYSVPVGGEVECVIRHAPGDDQPISIGFHVEPGIHDQFGAVPPAEVVDCALVKVDATP